MRNFWDIVRSRLPEAGACVLASDNQGTPILLAAGTDEAVEKGFNAGAVIKQISREIKGGGGGKPTMAQAGGKDVSGIDAALDAARKRFAAVLPSVTLKKKLPPLCAFFPPKKCVPTHQAFAACAKIGNRN